MDTYTVLYLTWTANKDFLYSTWNAARCHAAAWKGAGLGQNGFMLCAWLSAFAVHLNTPVQKKKKESPLQSQFPLHPSNNFSQFLTGSEARQPPLVYCQPWNFIHMLFV